jgi:hypothetical protein
MEVSSTDSNLDAYGDEWSSQVGSHWVSSGTGLGRVAKIRNPVIAENLAPVQLVS